jgi:hypothetical protein
MPELTYDQKLIHYATASRASAGIISQIQNGDFVNYWCGKLRGKFVQVGPSWKAATRQQAIESARQFREQCRTEAQAKGLLTA